MGLLEQWRAKAYDEKANKGDLQRLWSDYFNKEKEIYAQLLENPDEEVKGTVKELAERFDTSIEYMVGFLDGINDSLKEKNPIEDTLAEDTVVSLAFEKELLYKNMVAADADWLYGLEQWKAIFDEEKLHELYLEQKKSGTVRKETKIYPNDPCPCGSGKKYKKCHGRNK
ncbi:MAG: SEC-C domain-containing protein [Lachnospiraceae bacterium]|nr:SEC-C domain-containing protein [Lachnospiraceae bacterium]MBQ9642732.1 SEC-C domain-containing protein [Lachnospiraceae bacterium]